MPTSGRGVRAAPFPSVPARRLGCRLLVGNTAMLHQHDAIGNVGRLRVHFEELHCSRLMWMLDTMAIRMAAPVIMLKLKALIPSSVNPSCSTASTVAPASPPVMVPNPPANGVPP